jgi:hypothetical protein
MCGIVGYVGPRDATPIIYAGLKRLEYRGYDSAGLAVIEDGHIAIRRDAGKLERLGSLLAESPVSGHVGIGHTRWATHGEPTARNAHPHAGASGEVVLVHNGIVENFLSLREELASEGVQFSSDTDTEVIAHLVERYLSLDSDLALAARKALAHLRGAHGLVMVSTRQPDRIVAARLGNAGGVVIGVGEGEMFVASDIPAILEHTREMAFLEAGQVAVITRQGFQVTTLDGEPRVLEVQSVGLDFGDREDVPRAGVVEDDDPHPFLEAAQQIVHRAPGLRVDLDLRRRLRHRVADVCLRRRVRDVGDRDPIAEEAHRRVGQRRSHPPRENGRKEIRERPGNRARVGPGARHDQVLLDDVGRDAQALLHVGRLGLRPRDALPRVDEPEDRTSNDQHDRHRHQQLDQREP